MNPVTLYNEIWNSSGAPEAQSRQSLNPRGADMLYELFAGFGPTAQSVVLDVGCRDARHAIELARRFGCRVLGIDRDPDACRRAEALVAANSKMQASALRNLLEENGISAAMARELVPDKKESRFGGLFR